MKIEDLISKLPPMKTGAELTKALEDIPSYSEDVRNADTTTRLMALSGLYNIYNALGVIGMLVVGGYVSVNDVIGAFETMKAVDGRCERVYHDKMECTVVVDYAHTPDALENILKTMKEVTQKLTALNMIKISTTIMHLNFVLLHTQH